jgi:CDP-2,3-bis-(O-geranylgeranyl)-sn-glycerol synthase
MGVEITIFQALWFIWPAYTANAFPAVLNGRHPIDFGKKFGKNRLFGSSKTIEGTIGGILFGILMGLVEINIYPFLPESLGLQSLTFSMIVLLSVGALAGDIIGSFIKRRMNMKPGHPVILLDQLGFLFLAFLLVAPVFMPSFEMILILVIITPAIHLLANIVGYALKFKKHPW